MSLSPEEAIAQQRLALAHDYGQYVCGEHPIVLDGDVRVFNPGDPVPASWLDIHPDAKPLVEKVPHPAPAPTKTAAAAVVANEKKDA